ncbi:uncharacterized protein LOC116124957 [Pistacia vera]|uniref:uncharacterized protein LOC116124957 n=1 Tax=Pistacia vera TaxID=55513 RepID=UPI0012638080|nr:uncharacterized protein LOC116124957 [Pistacia vera]
MADPKASSSSASVVDEMTTTSMLTSPLSNTLPTVSVKLGERNYAYWKSQVLPALKAYDLEGFVTSEKSCPLSFFLIDESKREVNSEHIMWKKVDQFLFEMHFLTDSKARVLHLRNQLQTTRKDNSSINDYMLKMKEIAGFLTTSGVTVSDEELLLYILDGLGSEYDAMVATLTSRSSKVFLQEAQFLLHKHEMRLEK